MAATMGETMFSITRKNSAGDLVTTRGNTGDELLQNFAFVWGTDEANRYFTEIRHGDVRVGPERAAAVLSSVAAGDQVAAKAEAKADAGAKPASKALITAAAKKSGKSAEELAGITTDEAKALVKGEAAA